MLPRFSPYVGGAVVAMQLVLVDDTANASLGPSPLGLYNQSRYTHPCDAPLHGPVVPQHGGHVGVHAVVRDGGQEGQGSLRGAGVQRQVAGARPGHRAVVLVPGRRRAAGRGQRQLG